jgi:hypothetical protein
VPEALVRDAVPAWPPDEQDDRVPAELAPPVMWIAPASALPD